MNSIEKLKSLLIDKGIPKDVADKVDIEKEEDIYRAISIINNPNLFNKNSSLKEKRTKIIKEEDLLQNS